MHHLVVDKAVRAWLREFGLNITTLRGTEVKGLGTAHAVVNRRLTFSATPDQEIEST